MDLDVQSLFWVDIKDPESWEASLKVLPASEDGLCTSVFSATEKQSGLTGNGTSSCVVTLSESMLLAEKRTHLGFATILTEHLLPMPMGWESMSKKSLLCGFLLRQKDLPLACPKLEKVSESLNRLMSILLDIFLHSTGGQLGNFGCLLCGQLSKLFIFDC